MFSFMHEMFRKNINTKSIFFWHIIVYCKHVMSSTHVMCLYNSAKFKNYSHSYHSNDLMLCYIDLLNHNYFEIVHQDINHCTLCVI